MSKNLGLGVRAATALVAVVAVVLQVVTIDRGAEAITADQWRAGNIISNEDFFNGSAMSVADVQTFLNTKGSNCRDGSNPCLRNYSTSTPSTANEAGLCAGMPATGASTAAQIIYNVGVACGISQKVIIVMIQKESGIVTTTAPSASMYRATAGFACPDTAPCDAQYFGFFNQVYRMARQFKVYASNPTRYGYQAGRNNAILYNPNTACGSGSVFIDNQATANLYIYTPYQPNSAALANLYGTGDSCSAYGNRNFWRFYNDWFDGSSGAPGINPQGSIDSVTAGDDGDLRVQGWAYDGSQPLSSVSVRISVQGRQLTTVLANLPRSDLAYYGIPGNHGFDVTLKGVVDGPNSVCGTAVNIGTGADVALECKNGIARFNPIDPIGALDSAVADSSGRVALKGWAYDASSWNSAVTVIVTINGTIVSYASAAESKPDLAFYGIPGDHGFSTSTTLLVNGQNRVCAYAVNILGGATQEIGCKLVDGSIPGSPQGALEFAGQDGYGNITVRGYAYDPSDLYAPVIAVVKMNGVPAVYLWADQPRPELAYYGVPGKHGYQWTFRPTATGLVSVCSYAANIGPGADNDLGCSTLDLLVPGTPSGALDEVKLVGGRIEMSGWAWDPSVPLAPTVVMITVDGVPRGYLYADRVKPELNSYGVPGSHGYKWSIEASQPGAKQICAFAFNQGEGVDRLLGCRTV